MNIQPIEKLSQDPDKLDVHSIFLTIQGEGPFTGHRAVFIRLAGCNLQCPSCDTEYTNGRHMLSVEEIWEEVQAVGRANEQVKTLVVITGGEPLRQARALAELVRFLKNRRCEVQIETNGTMPLPVSFPVCYIVCSPKTDHVHMSLTHKIDAWKYVLSHDSVDPEDGLPIKALGNKVVKRVSRPTNGRPIYVQPMDAKNEAENRRNLHAAIMSAMEYGYILQLQVHKLINME